MAIRDLRDAIARLPEQPGVYLYFNSRGETIYVGRARALRDRVRSYLGAYGSSPKTDALLDEAVRLEVIVTDSVVEALALENNLIKARAPRYNILLRDDKNYPYLQLTTAEAFPRVLVARQVARDGNVYAGPFMPAAFAPQDDVADPPAVRDTFVQRGDHRTAGPAVPGVRHQALCRALRLRGLQPGTVRRVGRADPAFPGRAHRRGDCQPAAADAGGVGRGALRARRAVPRRGAHRRDVARPAAEDGDEPARGPGRLRREAGAGRRGDSGLPRCAAGGSSNGSSWWRTTCRPRPTTSAIWCRRRSSSSMRRTTCRPRCTCRSRWRSGRRWSAGSPCGRGAA